MSRQRYATGRMRRSTFSQRPAECPWSGNCRICVEEKVPSADRVNFALLEPAAGGVVAIGRNGRSDLLMQKNALSCNERSSANGYAIRTLSLSREDLQSSQERVVGQ